jgi:hypothetical protein
MGAKHGRGGRHCGAHHGTAREGESMSRRKRLQEEIGTVPAIARRHPAMDNVDERLAGAVLLARQLMEACADLAAQLAVIRELLLAEERRKRS